MVALGALLGAASALAQAGAAGAPVGELASLRARYGVALRSGVQTDLGPGLTYSGVTPNDLALSGAFWPGAGHFGLTGFGHREGFTLFDGEGQALTGGSLVRAHLGPAARVALGPVTLEGLAGYGFAQLPAFGQNSVQPQFGAATRHGPLFGARAQLALPFSLRLEVRGEYPLGLFAQDAAGAPATASGFSAGAALSWRGGSFGSVAWAVVADYQFAHDRLAVGDALAATQTLSRAGLGLELALLDKPPPPPPPRHGGVRVRVVDAETGAPLAEPKLVLLARGTTVKTVREADAFFAAELEPGEVIARAGAAGYLAGDAKAVVVAGVEGSLEVRIRKDPPKVGALAIVLVDEADARPIPNAVVRIKDRTFTSDAAGLVTVAELPPGPVALRIEAEAYRPADEVAQVVVFKTSQVPVQLARSKKTLPATVNGVVRSTRGGTPVMATLEIPEAQLSTTASERGTFSLQVPGGSYTVRISAPGFTPQSKKVTVREGDVAIFNVDLHPDRRR